MKTTRLYASGTVVARAKAGLTCAILLCWEKPVMPLDTLQVVDSLHKLAEYEYAVICLHLGEGQRHFPAA